MTTKTVTPPKQPRQFTGYHMLAVMLAFFGVIISVNVYMAMSAMKSWTGLVVENSYVASQQFNTKQRNAKAQDAMGWQGGLDYIDGTLRFSLLDGSGAPLVAKTVTIALSRPIGVDGDMTVKPVQVADGSYQTELALAAGAWNAAIVVTFDDQPDYEHRARLHIGVDR